jgi:hypothetical protein
MVECHHKSQFMNKNFKLLILSTILLLASSIIKAQQVYKFALKFDSAMFSTTQLKIDTTPDAGQKLSGYLVQPDGTKYSIHTYATGPNLAPKIIRGTLNGIVDYREGDSTFFIHFWYFSNDENKRQLKTTDPVIVKNKSKADQHKYSYVDSAEVATNSEFVFNVHWKEGYYFDIPFTFHCITASNTPLKYNFTTQQIDASLINFSVAYFTCYGQRRFFRNQDINSRDRYQGVGFYLGLAQASSNDNSFSQFLLTYGASLVFYSAGAGGLNIIPSFGFENGFTSQTQKIEPYVGIGLGINITSLSSYHN